MLQVRMQIEQERVRKGEGDRIGSTYVHRRNGKEEKEEVR